MQLWRERRNDSFKPQEIHEPSTQMNANEPSAEDKYKQARIAEHGTGTVELCIVRGPVHPVGASPTAPEIFRPKPVKVNLWNTLAEVMDANQASWVHGGSIMAYEQHDEWLAGLLGSKETKLCAVISRHVQSMVLHRTMTSDVCSVVELPVTPTTLIGELWQHAQAKRTQEEGSAGQMVVRVIRDQVEENVTLKTDDLVETLSVRYGGGFCVAFSGVPIDPRICWGEAFKVTGMVPNCELVLRPLEAADESGTTIEPVQWANTSVTH